MWEHPRGKDTFRLWAGVQSIHVVVGVGIGWLIYIVCTISYIYAVVCICTVSTFEALALSSSASFLHLMYIGRDRISFL